jgi:hypothetical protein
MRDDLTFSEEIIPYEKLLEYCYNYGSEAAPLNGRSATELYRGEQVYYMRKTHKGWKQAQLILIEKILELENEQTLLRNEVGGKVKRLPKEKQYIYDVLERHLRRLKDFADGIVWQMYGLDKSRVRAGMVEENSHGFLIDKNLDSGINYINQINKDPDSFAILSDLTTILGIGDVLQVADGSMRLVELKEGVVNGHLLQILQDKKGSAEKAREAVLEKYGPKKSIVKQLDRIIRQKERAGITGQYEEDKTSRHDHLLSKRVGVRELDHDDQNYLSEFEELCKHALHSNQIKTSVIDDCLFLAILPGAYDISSMFEIKHELYHQFMNPECDALKEEGLRNQEFEAISKIRLERLDSGFSIHGIMPLTFYLSAIDSKSASSIMTGELKAYSYLHIPSLISLAERMRLVVTRPRSRNNNLLDQSIFSWEGKNLVFDGVAWLVNTNYAEMCYGFVSPKDMLEKIKLSLTIKQ